MQELIDNRGRLIPYLGAFFRRPGLRGRDLEEDAYQQSCLLALENPRPLNVSELHKLANEAAVATIREEQRHHPT